MPAAAKTSFASKNPATIAKSVGTGNYAGSLGVQQGGEVVCPLFNSDGSQCRKKCVGNFAYRSICEHIRRAHPDNWIPKLPASPETFAKMVGLTPRGTIGSGPLQHHGVVRKQNMGVSQHPVSRKPSKLSKLDDEHYNMEGMSPPSSNESDSMPNMAHLSGPHQNFQSRFPPAYGSVMYERDCDDEDDDVDAEHEVDDDMMRHHTETVSALFFLQQHRNAPDCTQETEDEEYGHFGIQHPLHPYHQSHSSYLQHSNPTKPRAPRQKSQKRKRQSTLDSTTSSTSTYSSAGSRWDELIEAATTRAVVESTLPLSPPQTAQTLPSICPNTPTSSEMHLPEPKIECGDCRHLAPVNKSYVCTECVSGFCEECALSAGKRGVCTECRAFGVKFKPLKIVVRTA